MRLFFLIPVLLISTFAVSAQGVKNIQLKQEKVKYVPKSFYINDVVDDRNGAGAIGVMGQGGNKEDIALQNGAANSLKSFIANNVTQNKGTQPVVMHIATMDVTAKKRGEIWSVEIATTFVFYAGDNKLVEYTGTGDAQMDSDPADYIERYIREAVAQDINKFDSWWAQNKNNVVTAAGVKVNVKIGRAIDKPNCIVYALNRPLAIADFMGPVQGREYEMAVTASGIGVGYSARIENGETTLDVTITPYFNKAESWFKPEGRNTNVLAHEQTHFDIAAIKACELAANIRKTTFTHENYKQLLAQLQQENGQASGDEENAYDTETNHGTITDKQLEWQKKITEQVRTIGCY